jgi:hypothetical protein
VNCWKVTYRRNRTTTEMELRSFVSLFVGCTKFKSPSERKKKEKNKNKKTIWYKLCMLRATLPFVISTAQLPIIDVIGLYFRRSLRIITLLKVNNDKIIEWNCEKYGGYCLIINSTSVLITLFIYILYSFSHMVWTLKSTKVEFILLWIMRYDSTSFQSNQIHMYI